MYERLWNRILVLDGHLHIFRRGRGGGQVVSVLAFYFNNPRLNPSEADNFCLKRTKKRQQEFRKRRFKSVLILLFKKLR